MPSLERVITFRESMYKSSTDLIAKKGADYNRDQQNTGDTLFNLRVCEVLGIVPSTEEGILVRLSDKFMRLISLTKPGREAAVKDESVLDTIKDIHNYVDYLGLIWLERRETDQRIYQDPKSFSGLSVTSPAPSQPLVTVADVKSAIASESEEVGPVAYRRRPELRMGAGRQTQTPEGC